MSENVGHRSFIFHLQIYNNCVPKEQIISVCTIVRPIEGAPHIPSTVILQQKPRLLLTKCDMDVSLYHLSGGA